MREARLRGGRCDGMLDGFVGHMRWNSRHDLAL